MTAPLIGKLDEFAERVWGAVEIMPEEISATDQKWLVGIATRAKNKANIEASKEHIKNAAQRKLWQLDGAWGEPPTKRRKSNE